MTTLVEQLQALLGPLEARNRRPANLENLVLLLDALQHGILKQIEEAEGKDDYTPPDLLRAEEFARALRLAARATERTGNTHGILALLVGATMAATITLMGSPPTRRTLLRGQAGVAVEALSPGEVPEDFADTMQAVLGLVGIVTHMTLGRLSLARRDEGVVVKTLLDSDIPAEPEPQDLADAPDEVRGKVQELLSRGAVEMSEQARQAMEEKGLELDDIVEMLKSQFKTN